MATVRYKSADPSQAGADQLMHGQQEQLMHGQEERVTHGQEKQLMHVQQKQLTYAQNEQQSSLPLFDDPMMAVIPAQVRSPERVRVPIREIHSVNAHLLEARRLAQRMHRLRNQREEQTRTGQAICHHLKAMLTESRSHS